MKKTISLITVLALMLSVISAFAINAFAADDAIVGSGTAADPYLIGSKAALAAFAAAPADGAYYKLTADIAWSDYKQGGAAPAASNWTPITFKGTFDGNGHTVSGLYFNDPAVSYVGFFGVANGVIKNLTIKDSTFIGKSYVAGIVAGMESSEDKTAPATLTVENCVNYADVTGSVKDSYAGGVAGGLWASPASDPPKFVSVTVSQCVNYGKVTSTTGNSHIGGVVARLIAMNGVIDQCANFGDVTGVSAIAGGIVGQVGRDNETVEGYTYTVSNCFNAGKVTVADVVGGIVARGYNPVKIENCVNVGVVNATKNNGVRFGPMDGHSVSTVANCFYLEGCAANANDATLVGTGSLGNAAAKSLAEINSAATASALGDKWEYNETDGLTLKFLATASTAPETTAPETTAPAAPETTAPAAPETTAPSAPETSAPTTTPVKPSNPNTGDASAIILAAVCVAGLAAVMVTKKKER